MFSCKHERLDNNSPGNQGNSGGGISNVTCSPDTAYFQQQVLPIFISNCAMSGCHDATSREGGVNLSSYSSIMNTGGIRPFNPGSSKSWKKIIENNPGDRMPPAPKPALNQDQKDAIYKWIMQGATNNSCQASACDSTNITFSGTIRNILNTKCNGCHSGTPPQGGIDLTAYINVKAKVNDGRLWGAINFLPGFSAMPKGGNKLSDCEIKQFKKWIDAGAPNN